MRSRDEKGRRSCRARASRPALIVSAGLNGMPLSVSWPSLANFKPPEIGGLFLIVAEIDGLKSSGRKAAFHSLARAPGVGSSIWVTTISSKVGNAGNRRSSAHRVVLAAQVGRKPVSGRGRERLSGDRQRGLFLVLRMRVRTPGHGCPGDGNGH